MMNKGISKFLILTYSFLLLVCPFHIYAETKITTSNIAGCHITGTTYNSGLATNYVTCNLDNEYYGYADISLSYYLGSSSSVSYQGTRVTVSGNSFDVQISTSNQSVNQNKPINVAQINDNHIYLKSDLNSEKIMWMFPSESLGICSFNFQQNANKLEGINGYNNYKFPLFSLSGGDTINRLWLQNGTEEYLIIFINKNIYNVDTVRQYIQIENADITEFYNIETFVFDNTLSHVARIKFKGNNAATSNIKVLQNCKIMPIYCNEIGNKNISTDFALNFALSNSVLENLQSIANGTASSNESAADNDSATDDLVSASDSLFNQEDSFNNSMNSSLENIDTNNGLNAMGSKFASSANWVRVQFNRITDNTPFGSVLSFSLILGLALLLIGRWRHD